MRFTVASVLCVAWLTWAAEESGEYPYQGEITGDNVHIRAGFGINFKSLKQVDTGYRLTVTGKKGEWLSITVPEDCPLWVSKSYVAVQPDRKTGILTGDRVNVRADASLKSDVMGRLAKDCTVTIQAEEGDWFKIAAPETASAWVLEKYVRALAPSELAPQPPGPDAEVIKAKLELAEQALRKQLALPSEERSLAPIVVIFEEVIKNTTDRRLMERAELRLEQVRILQAIGEELKRALARARPATPEPTEPEPAKEPEKPEAREEVEAEPARPSGPAFLATGELRRLLVLGERPGTHKLVDDSGLLYVLKSEKLNLDSFVGKRVGVRGTVLDLRPRWQKPVIEVTEVEVLGR